MGDAAMNRLDAICSQIKTIAEHITGPEGYSLSSLCQVRDAILDAHDLIAGTIFKREATISDRSDPSRTAEFVVVRTFIDPGKPPEGGAA
jgi:hypothetical protein